MIRNNVIAHNFNSAYGGGIALGGAASAQVIDNIISDNTGSSGDGINFWAAGTPLIKGNVIKNNQSTDEGGVSIVNGSSATFVQNVIAGNKAATGGGVYSGSNTDTFINNTIANNDSAVGSGVYGQNATFINNIILGKSGQPAVTCFYGSPSHFDHNIVYTPSGNAYSGCTDENGGANGNLTVDPRLMNAALGYYGLMAGSPAIDAGNNLAPSLPATDFETMNRMVDGNGDSMAVVDIGAFEFDPTRPVAELSGVPTEFLTANSLTITVGGTGVVSYRYAVDGGAFTEPDIPVATSISLTGLANGQHSIVVLGKNALGREQLLSSATAATWVVNTETTNLTFSNGGTAPWFVQPLVSRDGIAYQSGAITNNQSSWMETTVIGPGAIRFWWKVSSSYSDQLRFAIDGNQQQTISEEVDWQPHAYAIGAGSHTLRWTYATDNYYHSGANAGWVDGITFEQGSNVDVTPPVTSPTPAGGLYGTGHNVALACSDGTGSGCTGTITVLAATAPRL